MNKIFKMLEMGDDWIKTFKILFARNKKFRMFVASSMVVLAIGVTQQVHALLIDSFDNVVGIDGEQFLTGATGNTSLLNPTPTGTTIGSTRLLRLDLVKRYDTNANTTNGVTAKVEAGQYSHSTDNNRYGTTSVTWNTAGAGLSQPNGVDLTDAGNSTALKLAITAIDQGNVSITFNIKELLGGVYGDTATIVLTNLGVSTPTFLFSEFSNYGIVDFTHIGEIKMIIASTGNASDMTLDLIETNTSGLVPEPTTLALISLGIAGFAAFRKRKQM